MTSIVWWQVTSTLKCANRRVKSIDGDAPFDGSGISQIYRNGAIYVRLNNQLLLKDNVSTHQQWSAVLIDRQFKSDLEVIAHEYSSATISYSNHSPRELHSGTTLRPLQPMVELTCVIISYDSFDKTTVAMEALLYPRCSHVYCTCIYDYLGSTGTFWWCKVFPSWISIFYVA